MKLQKAKSTSDIRLAGITAETEFVDGSLKRLLLRDANGGVLVIRESGYTMSVEVPAPPETVKRYRLAGTFAGLAVSQDFEEHYAAAEAKREYEQRLRSDEDSTLAVALVDVEVPE